MMSSLLTTPIPLEILRNSPFDAQKSQAFWKKWDCYLNELSHAKKLDSRFQQPQKVVRSYEEQALEWMTVYPSHTPPSSSIENISTKVIVLLNGVNYLPSARALQVLVDQATKILPHSQSRLDLMQSWWWNLHKQNAPSQASFEYSDILHQALSRLPQDSISRRLDIALQGSEEQWVRSWLHKQDMSMPVSLGVQLMVGAIKANMPHLLEDGLKISSQPWTNQDRKNIHAYCASNGIPLPKNRPVGMWDCALTALSRISFGTHKAPTFLHLIQPTDPLAIDDFFKAVMPHAKAQPYQGFAQPYIEGVFGNLSKKDQERVLKNHHPAILVFPGVQAANLKHHLSAHLQNIPEKVAPKSKM